LKITANIIYYDKEVYALIGDIMMKKNRIIYILIGIFLFLLSYTATKYINRLPKITMESLRSYILDYGSASTLIFLILYLLKPVIIILPTILLSIVAGNIYGSLTATALSMIGCFLSATFAFYISKILGRGFVEKFSKEKLISLDRDIEKSGFKIILLMRLSVIFPYDALSYAAGLTGMTYSDFILGTTIGILPEMIAYSYLGENLKNPLSIRSIMPLLAIGLCAITFSYIFKLKKDKE
jgi:uncharacterized membrane protein YdjX (TVP38/TMEM64 family)